MKNSLFMPVYSSEISIPFKPKEIEKILLEKKSFGVFQFSVLKSGKKDMTLAYNIVLVPLLHLALYSIKNNEREIGVKIKFSNILSLVFILQLILAFVIFILAGVYLKSSIFTLLLMFFPILIYLIGIINFYFLKNQVVKRLKKVEILLS